MIIARIVPISAYYIANKFGSFVIGFFNHLLRLFLISDFLFFHYHLDTIIQRSMNKDMNCVWPVLQDMKSTAADNYGVTTISDFFHNFTLQYK